jgi:hypothetical protein
MSSRPFPFSQADVIAAAHRICRRRDGIGCFHPRNRAVKSFSPAARRSDGFYHGNHKMK